MNRKIKTFALYTFALAICFSLTSLFALAVNDYSKAVLLYNKNKFAKALPLFQYCLDEGTEGANSAYYIGLCYHHLNHTERAKTAYLNVIKKYPKSSAAKRAYKALSQLDPSLAQVRNTRSATQKRRRAYRSTPKKVVVRYKSLKDQNHIILPVKINGVSTYMMFDTGASLTMCKQSFLDRLGVKVSNTEKSVRLHGVGGEVPTRAGLVNLTIANMTRTIPLMIEQDHSSKNSDPKSFDQIPLLGQNYFKDFTYEIDDSKNTITFSKLTRRSFAKVNSKNKNRNKRSNSDNEVPFQRQGSHIIVKPEINGRECEMILDTGAGSIVFADRHLALCGLNRPIEARSSEAKGIGGSKNGYNFYLKSIKLGPIERKNVQCAVLLHTRFSKPLLGQTFLKGLKYTIDPERNVIIFKDTAQQ